MTSFRLALMVLLAAMVMPSAYANQKYVRSDRIDDVDEIRVYAVGYDAIAYGASPEVIRKQPSFYFFVDRQLNYDVAKEVLSWLELDRLEPSSQLPREERVERSRLSQILVVVDILLTNGATKTYLADMDYLFDSEFTSQHLLSCRYFKIFFDRVRFGVVQPRIRIKECPAIN